MTEKDKNYINEWFKKADEDILAGETLFASSLPVLGVVIFHCQQAIEKYLKAFLIHKGWDLQKTHNLNLLQKVASEFDSDFLNFDFTELNEFAVVYRSLISVAN